MEMLFSAFFSTSSAEGESLHHQDYSHPAGAVCSAHSLSAVPSLMGNVSLLLSLEVLHHTTESRCNQERWQLLRPALLQMCKTHLLRPKEDWALTTTA